MGTAFRKVWRDLWNNKGRTLLVVVSIGVGVLALGMITATNTLLQRQMAVSQAGLQPTSIHLYLNGLVDDETVRALTRVPGVAGGFGRVGTNIRWKPAPDAEWRTANLVALDDYTHQSFDLVTLRSGAWPGSRSVAVEFNHVPAYGVPPVGGSVYFEVNNRAKPMVVGGTVRDPYEFPPPFSNQATFYATRDMLVLLGGFRDYNQVRFAIDDYSQPKAEAIVALLDERLEKIGIGIGFYQTFDPSEHFLHEMMNGVGLILLVMAIMSLGMSTILVVNTINAVIAQQVPQIGIMKTIGGLRDQIATLYLAGVAIYGLLSLLLAVPLGALGGAALAGWMLALLNVPSAPFEVLQTSLLLQALTGLAVPLLAALFPVLRGVAVSVREALSAYGVGTGRYGRRWLDRLLSGIQVLPRMAALALRNTFRRMSRVALTQITLVSAGAVFMMVMSAQFSFNETMKTIFRGFGYDVFIGFQQLQRIDKVVPLIEAQPNVDRAEAWVFYTAKTRIPGASGPGAKHEVFLRGVPVDTQLFTPELTAGRNLDPRDGRALLLNQKLARKMGVQVGDQIELDLGDSRTSTWTIVGLIFDLAGRDQNTAYMHRDPLNLELGWAGRAGVVEVRAQVNTLESQLALERDLRAFLEARGIGVGSTDTALEEQQQASAQFSVLTTVLLVMTFLIALVGSIGLSGTLSINVLERRREIGVMRALGASSLDVAVIFMGEALLLGLLSWLQAVPISVLAGGYFVEMLGETIDFPALYFYSFDGVWIWLLIVVILSMIASWLPARRATQISVRESLAYE
jgi:putative ABC transport system permease protein